MSGQQIRRYDETTDLDAVFRIWREVGWVDDDAKKDAVATLLRSGNAEVALMADEPECAVHWTPGTIDHTGTSLGLCAITAVTTSLIGRKQGFATTMTARALRQGAEAGHAVAALGMFEQGFYDRFGFGTGSDTTIYRFDPGRLMLDAVPYRTPVRLGREHWPDLHAAMAIRLGGHGSVCLDPPEILDAEMGFYDKPFGLGYRDDDGALTHFVFGAMNGEHGPLDIDWVAYRTPAELLELLRLLRELGDQVRTVRMHEPAHAQMQTLIREPMRDRQRTRTTEHEAGGSTLAWWQARIVDLPACVRALGGANRTVRFNLRVTDPVARFLDDAGWRGIEGDYTVEIDEVADVRPGHEAGLPTLAASVNALTRWWLGVRSASQLLATDDLSAPPELIAELDRLGLPRPSPGWMF